MQVPGTYRTLRVVPGSAKRRFFNRGHDLIAHDSRRHPFFRPSAVLGEAHLVIGIVCASCPLRVLSDASHAFRLPSCDVFRDSGCQAPFPSLPWPAGCSFKIAPSRSDRVTRDWPVALRVRTAQTETRKGFWAGRQRSDMGVNAGCWRLALLRAKSIRRSVWTPRRVLRLRLATDP